MGPKTSTMALFLALNILFFTLTVATNNNCGPPPNQKPNKPKPRPTPTPTPSTPSGSGRCPRDTLKIGVCVKALNLLDVKLGKPPVKPCCSLIEGLVDLEAAVCLCTALKLSVLGINLNVPIDLSVLLNVCGRKAPRGFQCP